MKINHCFETHGVHGKYSDNICTEASYQRNGISGAGFTVIKFTYVSTDHESAARDLIGIVFEENGHVAVIDPIDLESHWRGDHFEEGLRSAAKVYMTAWNDALDAGQKS